MLISTKLNVPISSLMTSKIFFIDSTITNYLDQISDDEYLEHSFIPKTNIMTNEIIMDDNS